MAGHIFTTSPGKLRHLLPKARHFNWRPERSFVPLLRGYTGWLTSLSELYEPTVPLVRTSERDVLHRFGVTIYETLASEGGMKSRLSAAWMNES